MTETDILRELVGIHSPFPNEAAVGLYLERFLKRNGFSTKRDYVEKGRFNLLAERGKGNAATLFYGHMDTVPMYGDWKGNAFKLRKEGDRLYGLGTCDMKGGVSALLESIKEHGKGRIKMLFCVDEENISEGAWHVIKSHRGWFNDVRVIVSAEMGDADKYRGSTSAITLGRRGRVVIALEIKGRSSHGAEPERGVSALEEAAKIALNIKKLKLRNHAKLGKESAFVRKIKSESTSLSVPDAACMEVDMHLVPPSTAREAKEMVENYIKTLVTSGVLDRRARISVYIKRRKTPYLEPYETDKNNKQVRKIISIMRRPKLSYALSVADENALSNALNIPVVTIGPKGGNEHSANEWVSRKSLGQVTTLFGDIADRM